VNGEQIGIYSIISNYKGERKPGFYKYKGRILGYKNMSIARFNESLVKANRPQRKEF